jgi:crotonobetainyl-CoA:carnitine CoA-transferase CaiB-like acyl-CoA transferase
MAAALSDLRVIDLSQEVAGPFCARLLADFGADVIKVEPPGGEPGRRLPPLVDDGPEPERSVYFTYLNSNKRGVVLDLEAAADRERLLALVRDADVVVESFAPGYLEGLGLGFAALEATKPGIILTSVTPWGQTGPWRDRPATDLTAYALSGWAETNRFVGRPPLKGSGYQASMYAGNAAFLTTLGAIHYRDRHGVGQQVDVSILESLTEIFGPRFLQAQHGSETPRPSRPDFLSGPVPSADGYFSMTLSRAWFWRDAMTVLGLPELADADSFLNRQSKRDELIARAEPAIAARPKEALFEELAAFRAVSGMVLSADEAFSNRHVRERDFFVPIDQPALGRVEMTGPPFRMSASPWALRRPSPRLGEHTEAVLAELGAARA